MSKNSAETELVNDWNDRIEYAAKVRDDADKAFGYNRAQKEFCGDYLTTLPSFVSDVPVIPLNEVYSYVKAFIASVYSRNPHIAVNPRGKPHLAPAKITELAINAYWRELNLKRQIKRAIVDAVFAEGWIKTGYSAAFGSIEKDEGKPGLEPSEYVKNEEIFATRVSWRNMVRDPEAVDGLYDARWVSERIIKPIEAVKDSGLYENTADLQPNYVRRKVNDQRKILQGSSKDVERLVVLQEIWDWDSEKVLTLAEGHPKILSERDWPYDMEGFAHSLLVFNDNPDECYAPNLIGPWEPQLWEKMKLRAMELDHIKRGNRQMSVEQGVLSTAELEKFKQGRTGSVIIRKKGSLPPAPIPYPLFQTDAYAVETRIDLDKDNVSGMPNAVRSAPQRTQSRTLGEIDRLITAFQVRQNEPQGIVEDFCAEVSTKLIALMKQFLPGEKWVRASQRDIREIATAFGKNRFDGSMFWFTKEDIQGAEFEVEVKAGSTLPLNREGRMKEMVEALKLGPTVGIVPGDKVSVVIGKNIFSELDIKEIEYAYEEKITELENMRIMARAAQQAKIGMARDRIAGLRQDVEQMAGGEVPAGESAGGG